MGARGAARRSRYPRRVSRQSPENGLGLRLYCRAGRSGPTDHQVGERDEDRALQDVAPDAGDRPARKEELSWAVEVSTLGASPGSCMIVKPAGNRKEWATELG